MIMGFTKPIEHFNLQRKKVITMNTLYVGIDVSSKSNVIYLMLPNGDKHSNFSVANSHEGSTQLVKRILSALTSHSLDTVLIGLEATSVYGDNLVYFLREDATLAPFNRKIHVLNPKQVKKFHDAYNDLPKNDYVDSFVIADCLRFGRINKEVQDPADPLFLCQILQRHKQMALAQITAVFGVEAYFLLLQFIHLYDLVDSPQLTGHPPGDLQVTGWVEPAVKCHCVHPFPCFGSRVSRQFKEQA